VDEDTIIERIEDAASKTSGSKNRAGQVLNSAHC
jgi:hypothetical protein